MFNVVMVMTIPAIFLIIGLIYNPFTTIMTLIVVMLFFAAVIIALNRIADRANSNKDAIPPDYEGDPYEDLYDYYDDDTPAKRGPGRPRKGS